MLTAAVGAFIEHSLLFGKEMLKTSSPVLSTVATVCNGHIWVPSLCPIEFRERDCLYGAGEHMDVSGKCAKNTGTVSAVRVLSRMETAVLYVDKVK